MSFELNNSTVIVTGAARGIGLAISQRFHQLGATVCGWDLDCTPISSDPAFAARVDVDITDESAVEDAYKKASMPLALSTRWWQTRG